jgi:hypothetical protein
MAILGIWQRLGLGRPDSDKAEHANAFGWLVRPMEEIFTIVGCM